MKFDNTLTIAIVVNIIGLLANIFLFIINYRQSYLQRRIQILSILRQFHDDLRKWANDVVDSMSEAVFLCDLNPEKDSSDYFKKRHNLRIKLSSLTDKGRWFLPNDEFDNHGNEKPLAYRGFRKKALDLILQTYDIVGKLNYNDQKPNLNFRKDLADNKRYFVSEILNELDPNKIEKEKNDLSCK